MGGKIIATLVSILLLIPGCVESDAELIGQEYRDPPEAPDFTLKNQRGEEVSLSDYEGKVVIVAFIYTSCPDVCLIISANLDYVQENLGESSDKVEILSITIDPARDTVPHLYEWTNTMGYEWDHLTSDRASSIRAVWDNWNVVVDAEHIANSLPPEDTTVRFAVLNPDNSSIVTDNPCDGSQLQICYSNGSEFAEYAFRENANITYDISEGVIGEWRSNDSWTWLLHSWDSETEVWTQIDSTELGNLNVAFDTHLAWVASNANLSNLAPGVDCNGKGWVMGTGSSAHCMCDEGWTRSDEDWLSCVSEDGTEQEHSNGTDPHEESLGEYEVGHSTVTFIVDKNHRKRVAYSGINWNVDDFLHDVKELSEE